MECLFCYSTCGRADGCRESKPRPGGGSRERNPDSRETRRGRKITHHACDVFRLLEYLESSSEMETPMRCLESRLAKSSICRQDWSTDGDV